MTEKARDRSEQPDSRYAITEGSASILLATHSQFK